MTLLHRDIVKMGATAADKDAALSVVAHALMEQGLVGDDYAKALKLRESEASTYLGSGLAIPHGTPSFKDSVKKTGVVLVHFAEGVDWGEGQMVYVAAGIAAKSDEHLGVLKILARSLGDDSITKKLQMAKTPDDIIHALSGESQGDSVSSEKPSLVIEEVTVSDVDELQLKLAMMAKKAGMVGVQTLGQSPVFLGNGVACISVPNFTKKATQQAVLAALPKQALHDHVESVSALLLLAGLPEQTASAVMDELLVLNTVTATSLKTALAELTTAGADDYAKFSAVLLNRHGLHARPATFLTGLVADFEGEVLISTDDNHYVSAKSLTRLLALGAEYGQTLYFKLSPTPKTEEMAQTLLSAVAEGLGEEAVPLKAETSQSEPVALRFGETSADNAAQSLSRGVPTQGVVASKGLAVAEAFVVSEPVFVYEKMAQNPEQEKAALKSALESVNTALGELILGAKSAEIADIFAAHQGLLKDEELIKSVHESIDEGLSAAYAWHGQIERAAATQAALGNVLLAQRAADLRDVGRRVLGALCGHSVEKPSGRYVLIKDDLLPSDVAVLGDDVAAIVTAVGGASSHAAIIARSLGIPALVGAGTAVLDVNNGEKLLVNAVEGYFVASPEDTLVEETLAKQAALEQALQIAKQHAHESATTTDGQSVHVMANLGDVANAAEAVTAGAEGVGLLRTELVFMKHSQMPNLDAQMADYAQVFDEMDTRPVVVRTLDVGGDKPLPYLAMNSEENPFLGVRGIRLSLDKPHMLKEQLTALVRASLLKAGSNGKVRPLRIMFPMVGQLDEWYAAKALVDEVLAVYPHDDVEVGMMVEVPSSAILAHKFAPHVDFFSIGTNDLTQYTLAIDRGHPVLSARADGLDPSVLALIDMTVKAAHAHGKWVGVCGELGADTAAVPVLLGLGVDELSVSSSQIALVKAQIRTLSMADCQSLATKVLAVDTAKAVRELVAQSGMVSA